MCTTCAIRSFLLLAAIAAKSIKNACHPEQSEGPAVVMADKSPNNACH
jgi:hypothetical protein